MFINHKQNNRTFIVEFWSAILNTLYKASPFNILTSYLSYFDIKITARGVDFYCLLSMLMSAGLSILSYSAPYNILSWTLIAISALRVNEIIIYQLKILIIDWRKSENYSIESSTRLVVLLMQNFVEIIFWFSTIHQSMQNLGYVNLKWMPWKLSFVAMFGYTNDGIEVLRSLSGWPHFIQTGIGMLLLTFILSRTVSLLPKFKTNDPREVEPDQ